MHLHASRVENEKADLTKNLQYEKNSDRVVMSYRYCFDRISTLYIIFMATGGPESAAALEQSASPADRLSGLRAGNAEVNNRLDGAGIEGRTKAQSALREAMDAERAALGVETRGSLGVDGMMQTAQQLNRRDGRGEPYGGFSQRATGNL